MVLIVKLNAQGKSTPADRERDYLFLKSQLGSELVESLTSYEVDSEALIAALCQGKNCIEYLFDILS